MRWYRLQSAAIKPMFKKTAEVVKAYDNDKIGKYFLPNVQKECGGGGVKGILINVHRLSPSGHNLSDHDVIKEVAKLEKVRSWLQCSFKFCLQI